MYTFDILSRNYEFFDPGYVFEKTTNNNKPAHKLAHTKFEQLTICGSFSCASNFVEIVQVCVILSSNYYIIIE